MTRGLGATDASKGSSEMSETLVERVWAWLHETFPERQIYIRSDGRVQFFTFGPTLQATLAGLSLIFLGWVAFATVNVIFKDRIIAAKDHHYQQMQSAYENQLTDLKISRDELNGALVSAEDKFKSTADELQNKQNTIMGFLNRRQQVQTTLGAVNSGIANIDAPDEAVSARPGASDSISAPGAADTDGDVGGSELGVMPQPVAPAPRTGKPAKASFLDFGAFKRLASAIFGGAAKKPDVVSPAAFARYPVLRQLEAQTNRVKQIGTDETKLMAQTQLQLIEGVDNLKNVMSRTGINPDQFAQRIAAKEGVGGPELPLQSLQLDGINDSAFQDAYLRASAVLEQMDELLTGMQHIPLTTPVFGSQFERTSGFGARIDPFTGRYSFHPGVDFAGPWGAAIAATAPGTIVFAGNTGADSYGNMVEIDHGFGIHTRYGHLSSILVQVGAKVNKGAIVGKLGSTGRSTGPHVHYEVWYDGVVRNPSKFIEAGRHVFE